MSTDRIGDAIRRARRQRGLSLADLGRQVNYSRKTIWDFEVGRRHPTAEAVAAIDNALHADGRLVEVHARDLAAAHTEYDDRVHAGLSGNARPDDAMRHHLAAILAGQRALEDTAGAQLVLPAALQQTSAVEQLRRDATGAVRRDLLSLESQHAQFVGWCYQDLGDNPRSEQWYARALLAAHEAGDENMVASVLSMRSNAAWDSGDAHQAVALGEAATRPRATPGVLALSHQQAARGYARLGDRRQAELALDAAARLSQAAARDPEREPPWTYFFDENRFAVQRALILRELGEHRAAVDLFRDAVGRLPGHFLRDRAVYLGRLAHALALDGQREEAVALAAEARVLAERTGSTRARSEVASAEALLMDR